MINYEDKIMKEIGTYVLSLTQVDAGWEEIKQKTGITHHFAEHIINKYYEIKKGDDNGQLGNSIGSSSNYYFLGSALCCCNNRTILRRQQ